MSPEPPSSTEPDERASVLVIDDEPSMAEMVADGLCVRGYDAVPASSSKEAARLIESGERSFDAVVTDLRMPGVDGLEMLSIAKRADAARPVIVMTAFSAVDSAIESIRRGAYHYLTKPFKVDELALFLGRALDEVRLRKETASLRRALHDRFSIENLIGTSAAMREVADLIDRVARTSVPVLILGETGTGKGVVARAIHAEGPRARAPFVGVNCAALPENLLESELFGHVKGAFTGASQSRRGLVAEADGGTLLLDEIGEMSPALQAKLLHVLESKTVRPIGGTKEHPVDVRLMAATHRDLRARVATGEFREDLLYRLEVVTMELPPLRHRRGDLPDLIDHFLARERLKHPQSCVESFGPDAIELLLDYGWPGNVRELEHLVERVVVLGRSPSVTATDLPASVRTRQANPTPFSGPVLPIREVQRRYAAWAFQQLEGRRMVTAEKLGIDDKTLARWLADEQASR
ncbi:MAG: sigma-54-dependent transcriptional regulator [Polyangiaceae bacterium]|jgi:two-component system, NtrC family, response regulator HydG